MKRNKNTILAARNERRWFRSPNVFFSLKRTGHYRKLMLPRNRLFLRLLILNKAHLHKFHTAALCSLSIPRVNLCKVVGTSRVNLHSATRNPCKIEVTRLLSRKYHCSCLLCLRACNIVPDSPLSASWFPSCLFLVPEGYSAQYMQPRALNTFWMHQYIWTCTQLCKRSRTGLRSVFQYPQQRSR